MVEIATKPISERRRANKAEVAEWFGVSMATVDAWLRRGCPYVQRGNKGLAWIIDLRAAAEWYYKGDDPKDADDPDKMTPKERLDWYKGTREKTKHMEEAGQLIPAADYERALSSALKTVAVTLESLPDVLERDAGIDGAAVEACQKTIDRVRDELFKKMTADA